MQQQQQVQQRVWCHLLRVLQWYLVQQPQQLQTQLPLVPLQALRLLQQQQQRMRVLLVRMMTMWWT
jgi:hypothetical protein